LGESLVAGRRGVHGRGEGSVEERERREKIEE
jgi:hypothetical protein